MWNGSRINAARHAPAIALLCGAFALVGAASADKADISVEVTKLRSTKGVVHACLTSDARNFPDCDTQPAAHKATIAASRTTQIAFRGVKPGRYAIAILHDENNNGKVDKALMIPKEGFGFSRDAKVRMGPPKFKAAAVDVKAGENAFSIKMRYIF